MIRFKRLVPAAALMAALGIVLTVHAQEAQQAAQQQPQQTAKVGEAAPSFTLKDQNGKEVSLSDHEGKIVVLEWFNNECPYVVRHYQKGTKAGTMNEIAKKYADKDVVWLAVNSTSNHDQAHNKEIAGKWNIDRPILTDNQGKVGQLYGARTTPHMFIIDKEGQLVYAGGIDDDPRGNSENPTNYVAKALDELLAGESVSTSESRPYGCGIKYN